VVVRRRTVAIGAGLVLLAGAAVAARAVWNQSHSDATELDFGVAVAVGADQTVYVADRWDTSILAVRDRRLREVFADPALEPLDTLAVDADGQLLVAAGDRHIVRIRPGGRGETLIDDITEIRDIDGAPDGSVYVVGGLPARVVRIAADGIRTEVGAPAGATGVSEAAVDDDGTLVVLSDWRIWRLPASHPPELVAGSLDPAGETGNGDGGPAEHALLQDPYALTVTSAGYFFCDEARRHVRRVDRSGVINTVVTLALGHGCVDLAAAPGTSDLILLDADGAVTRLSPDGRDRQVLYRPSPTRTSRR
jgi:hypothetical protein